MFLCGHCHGNSTFTKRWEGVREQYRIVLGKHPWVLAAQAPKIEDEWLHGRSVWTPQVSPRKCPPRPEYEVSCQGYQLDLHCCFACALSRPANSGESCIALESRLTHSLVAKLSQRSLLAFVLQSRNASYLQTRLLWMGVCKTLASGCRGTWRSIAAMYMTSARKKIKFSMVAGYTEDLKKPQNGQNWKVGACWDNTVILEP